jgi:PAS domain S-box-containing protein
VSQRSDAAALLEFHIGNSPLVVIEWDHEFRVRRWSGRAQVVFGWAAAEVQGCHPDDWPFVHPDDKQSVQRVITELLDGTVPRNVSRNRNLARDGSVLDCEWYNSAQRDPQGRVQSILSLVHDVTRQRRNQLALKESEGKFRAVVEGAPDAIFFQIDRRFAYVNPAALHLFGATSRSELVGQPVLDRFHPDFHAVVLERIRGLNEHKQAQPAVEQTWLRLDGSEIPVEVSAVPLSMGGRDGALVFARDISDRLADRRRLDDNARLLDMAATIAQIGGWEVELETGRVHWSDEVRHLLGFPADKEISLTEAFGFVAPEWRAYGMELFADCAENGVPHDDELQMLTADGRRVWVRSLVEAVRDVDGRIVRVQGAFQDISRRKEADARLELQTRRTEALLGLSRKADELGEVAFMQHGLDLAELLTDSAVAFIHLVHEDDEEIELVTWSQRTAEARGDVGHESRYRLSEAGIWAAAVRQREPVVVNDYAGYAPDDGRPELHDQLRRVVSVPVIQHGKVVMLAGVGNKDSDYTALDVETLQLFSDAIWRMVHNRRTTSWLRRLSFAVEQSPNSIMITDLDARIEYVNEAFLRLTGYARDEVLGENPRLLKSGKTPPETYAKMWAALAGGRSWQGEFRNRGKDGTEFIAFAYVVPLRQPDGTISNYVSVGEDITEKLRIAAELEGYRNRLEELVAQRTIELAEARRHAEAASLAKSAFLANMSHEIRTPMNGVLGMLEILAQSELTDEQSAKVEIIRQSGKALAGVIDDVLDFSKIEAGRLELERIPVSIREVVEGLCDSLVPVAAANQVRLNLFVAPEIPTWVLSDEVRLRQLLYNLVGNGIKFSKGLDDRRGHVKVRVDPVSAAESRIRFSIADNGVGMTQETIDRLFTPFTQGEVATTRRFGGTGLGLTISRRIIDLIGGSIEIRSTLGVGSEFVVELPLVAAEGAEVALPDLAGVHCTLVESAEYPMDDLAIYLRHAGADVRVVPDPVNSPSEPGGEHSVAVLVRHIGNTTPERFTADADTAAWRLVLILAHGQQELVKTHAFGVTLDENAQRMEVMLHAVAVAAGRVSPHHGYKPEVPMERIAPTTDDAHRDGLLVLVAEDDEVNRQVISQQLELLGYAAEVAVNGREALRMWLERDYGLVLTDLHMPEMDGYTLAREIRKEEARRAATGEPSTPVPIIALTANALRGEAERALAIGIVDYLVKPLPLERLRAALDRWLAPPADEAQPQAFDIEVLKGFVGDDADMLRNLLEAFLESTAELNASLSAAVSAGDAEAVAAIVHKVKSSSRWVGALPLGDFAAELETAARAGDLGAVGRRTGAFAAALDGVRTEIANMLRASEP